MREYLTVYERQYNNQVYNDLSMTVAIALDMPARVYWDITTESQQEHNDFMLLCQDAAFEICGRKLSGKVIELAITAYQLGVDVLESVEKWLNLFGGKYA